MADKMMRVAGRGADGLAKAVRTDAAGNVTVRPTDKLLKLFSKYNTSMLLDFSSDEPFTNMVDDRQKFTGSVSNTPTIVNVGPLGKSLDVPEMGYIRQNPLYECDKGTSVTTYFPKVATFLGKVTDYMGFARAYISKVGNVDSCKVTFRLYTDNAGVPGVPWETTHFHFPLFESDTTPYMNGTDWVGDGFYGFPFVKPCIAAEENVWLVMEYVDSTGIDASNYFGWHYETTSTYTKGGKRATFDGTTWTVTSGQNHRFSIHEPVFPDGDFTIISLLKQESAGAGYVLDIPGILNGINTRSIVLGFYGEGYPFSETFDGVVDSFYARENNDSTTRLNEWVVLALTFSKEKSRDKARLYVNGKPARQKYAVAYANNIGTWGAGGSPILRVNQPLTIGNRVSKRGGSTSNKFIGNIGMFAILDEELSADDVREISTIIKGGIL